MKNLLIATLCTAMLAACGKGAPVDTVDSLMTNPERLKMLRAQCKADHAKTGDALCNIVSEATRRRFMGEGNSPYASDPVLPASASSAGMPKD